ncbi:MAG: NAD-dependent epimerase [Eubacteriales bacterium]|nr:NAD-dependent epimerase [Eubacteriales bacterium]
MIDGYKELDITKRILITGAAGFIGFHLSRALLDKGVSVIGFDNLNDYYDVKLKEDRLNILNPYEMFTFIKGDLSDKSELNNAFEAYKPNIVVNLAAQAGVRYSIENPDVYIQSNITGFFNILECCRHYPVEHLLYASSSSVYGGNKKVPFSEKDSVDAPVSLYAATKKSNELMAYTYSHLYGIPATGLRFFTVYGPWGRPDMAYFSFTKAILDGKPIKVFNHGDMYRDFTYIDDVVEAVERILCNPPKENDLGAKYKVYNIGNSKPEKLMDFIETLEAIIGKKAIKEFYPMQDGDVHRTYADVEELQKDFGFSPATSIRDGLGLFIVWYKGAYA